MKKPDKTGTKGAIEVTLLGTSGPEYSAERVGPSTLLLIDGQYFLFDAGRCASQRMVESDIPLGDINKVFLTHLDSDHLEGLPNLWMGPWLMLMRKRDMEMWGPTGTKTMTQGMREMFTKDLVSRPNEELKMANLDIRVTEFTQEGVIYDDGKTTITAFDVEHGPGNPAYGFRIDYNNHSVVLSGDTTYHKNVVKYGKDCDLLVHSITYISPERIKGSKMVEAAVVAKQTTPPQAARVLNESKPKLAVFSHISKSGRPDQVIVDMVRGEGYAGPLEMGQDGMKIIVGDQVTVAD